MPAPIAVPPGMMCRVVELLPWIIGAPPEFREAILNWGKMSWPGAGA